ncbi:MAG: 30S ribosomal protein S4 [Promethearchaeota archaeon]
MGDPKFPKKKYKKPFQPWQKDRMAIELELVGKYGLRNKKEYLRHEAYLRKIREQTRQILAVLETEKREKAEKELISRLARLGLISKEAVIDDVLSLTTEGLLKRRLQTIVFRLGFAKSIHHARQLLAHGHIALRSQKVTSPSRLMLKEEENELTYAVASPYMEENHPERPSTPIHEVKE